jgi:hypothetical protein
MNNSNNLDIWCTLDHRKRSQEKQALEVALSFFHFDCYSTCPIKVFLLRESREYACNPSRPPRMIDEDCRTGNCISRMKTIHIFLRATLEE